MQGDLSPCERFFMPFEFFQVPAGAWVEQLTDIMTTGSVVGGQGSGKEGLNWLMRSSRIASVRKEFVQNGDDSFWAFCVEVVDGTG